MMPGKLRPALLNQILEELNIMERQSHPAFGKAKRDGIRQLVNRALTKEKEIPTKWNDMAHAFDWLQKPAEEGWTMERLTKHRDTPLVMSMWYGNSEELKKHNRLAAYEDTGLAPEEITANMEMFAAYRHVCGGISPEEVEKLIKAQQALKSHNPQQMM